MYVFAFTSSGQCTFTLFLKVRCWKRFKNVVLVSVLVTLGFGVRIQTLSGQEAVQLHGTFELVHLGRTRTATCVMDVL